MQQYAEAQNVAGLIVAVMAGIDRMMINGKPCAVKNGVQQEAAHRKRNRQKMGFDFKAVKVEAMESALQQCGQKPAPCLSAG